MVGLLDEDLGPVEVIAIGFDELSFDERVLGEITDLVDRGLVRIVDLLGVRKGLDDVVRSDEHGVLEREARELFDGLAPTGFDLLGLEDVDLAAAELTPGGSAIIVVWEERWALPLSNAIRRAGGAVLIHQLVPRDVLVELLGDPGLAS